MKKAVMYGAGNIGRGFIGKVFSESGYEVCFLDIADDIIAEMNRRHEYKVHIISNDIERYDTVNNVSAVNAMTPQAIERIAGCDLMATAVGAGVLSRIAPTVAKGLSLRIEQGGGPLDIILAENQLDADKLMRGYIYDCLDESDRAWADKNLGLVEASIGRMVPRMTEQERMEDPLLIAVEPYAELPADSAAFKGAIPQLVGLIPYSPFGFYVKRKLYIHNMGHALCAYFGWRRNYEYIWEAVADDGIYEVAKGAMTDVANALSAEYDVPLPDILDNVEDLLYRFGNKALGDTVARVAADPVRKLRKDDRLTGAALYCIACGYKPGGIAAGIAAAIAYDNPEDVSAGKVQKTLQEEGAGAVIERYMGLEKDSTLAEMVREAIAAID